MLIKCPYCQNLGSKVIDKRNSVDFERIRRRRECLRCTKRWTTAENLSKLSLFVVKKDGKIESFNREKLLRGLYGSCGKKRAEIGKFEALVDEIEKELRSNDMAQVHSSLIGSMVLNRLREMDKIAYLRFLSIHRDLDVGKLKKEIKEL